MNAIHDAMLEMLQSLSQRCDPGTYFEKTIRGYADMLGQDRPKLVLEDAMTGLGKSKGKWRSRDLDAIWAFLMTEPARLGAYCRKKCKDNGEDLMDDAAFKRHETMIMQITIGLRNLDNEVKRLANKLTMERVWNRYPNHTMMVTSAWMTQEGESVGNPQPRRIPKEQIPLQNPYTATLDDPAGSMKLPIAVLAVSQGGYRKDDTGITARQEFLIDIPNTLAACIAGCQNDEPDMDVGVRAKTPARPTDARVEEVHKVIAMAAPLFEQCAELVETMRGFDLLDRFDFKVYGYSDENLARSEVSAEANPLAVIEIGSFS